MKFKTKRVALAVAQALGVGGAIAIVGTPAHAQDLRITVTGSSIKRVETEGALPVITLDRAAILQTGAQTAADLIQSLPSMQNFVPTASSVNGGGGGIATAALHGMPSKYTLVLINGQRTASLALGLTTQGGGSSVNLQSIPLAAVEKVEILTDGASAIYGSDAIAGVVNFILRKTETEGTAFGQWTHAQQSGGGGWNAGISKGWGDLDKDRFNIMFSYEHNQQDALEALQRDVSKRGAVFPFSQNGVNYIFNQATSNTEPSNIQSFKAYPTGGNPANAKSYTFNPYYRLNGNCGNPALTSVLLDPTGTGSLHAIGESCRFNYAATVQDIPANVQDAVVVNGTWRINDTTTGWANYNFSDNTLTSQYAPPAQPFGINPTTRVPTLYNNYVVPFLTANNLTIVQPANPSAPWATVGYRGVSLGGRTDAYNTQWNHVAAGVDTKAWGWDLGGRFLFAQSELKDNYIGGYADSSCVNGAIAAGKYDPVLATGGASVQPCVLNTLFADTKSRLTNLHLSAQHDLWDMPGGMSIFAAGFDYFWSAYQINYGPYGLVGSGYSTQDDLTATAVGGNGGQTPIDAHRNNWAVFGEVLLPVLKNLEIDGTVRYDKYDKTTSNYVFSDTADANGVFQQIAPADLGNTFSDTTYKVTGRWTPFEKLLVRGSYGTGFKAPSVTDIAGPLVFNGSTSNTYTCPFPGTAGCIPGSAQYDLLAGPNGLSGSAGLAAEKSTQWTVGARYDGIKGLSFGADWWDVKIKKQVLSQGIAEQVAFANPQQYKDLFVNPYIDPVGGFTTIALIQAPFNGGQAEYEGLDWDLGWRTDVPWWNLGVFSVNYTGTYIYKAQYTFGPGQPYLSSLAQYGPDQGVVFRFTQQVIMNLATGPWNNSLTMHAKSGYQDASYLGGNPADVFFMNPDGTQGALATTFDRLHVGSYITWDYQVFYNMAKADPNNPIGFPMKFTFGITNLFDKKPPLSLQTGGGGNAVGYDQRYADATGRAFYVRGELRF
jgi:iron complex outermembrane receptor protein